MGKIVVGVDGSEPAAAALRWAVEEARFREATLEVVLAWDWLDQERLGLEFRPEFGEEQAVEVLRGYVTDAVGEAGIEGLDVVERAVCDRPAHALLEAAEDADLVVVGDRGHGGFADLLLGSVSAQVVNHAPCPVLVVRQTMR